MSVEGWNKLLSIHGAAYLKMTLEVLASFEFDKLAHNYDQPNVVSLWYLGNYHSLGLTEFTLFLGFYELDYVLTEEYAVGRRFSSKGHFQDCLPSSRPW